MASLGGGIALFDFVSSFLQPSFVQCCDYNVCEFEFDRREQFSLYYRSGGTKR